MATVVTGCARSRTSLTMLGHKHALGLSRIIGSKWPRTQAHRARMQKLSPAQIALERRRTARHSRRRKKENERLRKSRDMNPLGFWEQVAPPWTVQGIKYEAEHAELLARAESPSQIIKLVTSGLSTSDPKYVHRVVYLNRHPRAVATSQENLNSPERDLARKQGKAIHSPAMWIHTTAMAAKWILANPDIPLLLLDSDRMISEPDKVWCEIAEFEDEPLLARGAEVVDPKLNRSKPKNEKSPLWQDAEAMWDLSMAGDWAGVADYYDNQANATKAESMRFRCDRQNRQASVGMCKACLTNTQAMRALRRNAHNRGVEYRDKPCAYECGAVPGVPSITIDESIKNNHWLDGTEPSRGLGDAVARLAKKVRSDGCDGCERRRDALNRLFPFKTKRKRKRAS
jgi:hypothetical protein